jgi:hypothetical protein
MKRLKVVTKEEGMSLAKSIPTPCSIETPIPAQYIWHGSEMAYVGIEHSVPDSVLAMWVEPRHDENNELYAKFRFLIDRS